MVYARLYEDLQDEYQGFQTISQCLSSAAAESKTDQVDHSIDGHGSCVPIHIMIHLTRLVAQLGNRLHLQPP